MKSEEIADWQWLTSDGADSYLRKAREHAGPLHQLISQLRKSLSDVQARLVTQQVELRRRAAQKFSLAGRMLFTSKLLEQSTDEVIALYKASRFPTDAAVHDICCGIGGDLMALLSRGAVVGVDQDPVATLLARHNAQLVLHGEDDAAHAFESTSIDDVTVADLSADWVHIDPDRRPGDQQLNADQTTRVTAWEYLQPGPDVLQTLRDKSRGVAIKIAAATSPPATA